MSVQASLTIYFDNKFHIDLSQRNLIHLLIKDGWTINDCGGVTYLPVEDNEEYNWMFQKKISYESMLKILQEKEEKKEQIGIALTWQHTNIGGTFVFHSPNILSINFLINRQIFYEGNQKITNVNWYLARILPAFYKNDIGFYSYTFEELR